MTTQELNGNMLIALWNAGESMWDRQLMTLNQALERVEKRVWLGLCQAETGYEYPCHRTASVTDLESERRMCIRCFREIE